MYFNFIIVGTFITVYFIIVIMAVTVFRVLHAGFFKNASQHTENSIGYGPFFKDVVLRQNGSFSELVDVRFLACVVTAAFSTNA